MIGEPIDRVRAVLAVGARIADPNDSLGIRARERLWATSGLSQGGVDLALCQHLETTATDDELAQFVARAGHSDRCAVVLSANVCTAPLRAIAFALAAAPRVWVKPSRRDPALAEILAAELDGVTLVAQLQEALAALEDGDELHVYGSDEAIAKIADKLQGKRDLVVRAHGTGFGVALVDARASIEAASSRLAVDVVPFDGKGCLSPRVCVVEGDPARAGELAEKMHAHLTRLARYNPRGPLDDTAKADLTRYRQTMTAIGRVFDTDDHLVALDPAPKTLALPPPERAILVVPATRETMFTLLFPWAAKLTCFGLCAADELHAALGPDFARARVAQLGRMQDPPFDGPVDLRPL